MKSVPEPVRRIAARARSRPSPERRALGRHFAKGGAPVVLTDRYDVRFVLHEWELDAVDELLSKAFYKPDFLALEALLSPGDTAVDVGANVGTHSIMMGRRVGAGGRVIAFEPVPATAWAMRENLALNRIENVQLVEAAVSDSCGSIEMNLFDPRYSAWNSRGAPVIDGIAPVEKVSVRAETLDEMLRTLDVERVNFLKIDVEGYEIDVLRGASGLLGSGAVDHLCFEISQLPLQASGHTAREVFDQLGSFGYLSYSFDEDTGGFVGPFEDSDDFYANFYASRQDLRSLR